jgi:hypothetical protein
MSDIFSIGIKVANYEHQVAVTYWIQSIPRRVMWFMEPNGSYTLRSDSMDDEATYKISEGLMHFRNKTRGGDGYYRSSEINFGKAPNGENTVTINVYEISRASDVEAGTFPYKLAVRVSDYI